MERLLVALLFAFFSVQGANAQGLRQAVESAWSRNAELTALDAQRQAVTARQRAAASWIPNPPNLSASYIGDRLGRNRGFHEVEVEIGVPVWLPGESTASRRVADAEMARLEAQLVAQRLVVVGEVREAYWNFVAAQAQLAAALRRHEAATATVRDIARQVRAGQSARTEHLTAQAEAADAESAVQEQEAAKQEAQLQYSALVGREPQEGWSESLRTGAAAAGLEAHPRLVSLRRAIEVAQAELRLAQVQDRDSPEIGLIGRLERGDRDEPFNRIVGARVRIPFATEARNAPRITRAQAELTRAIAEHQSAERQIRLEIDRARLALTTATSQQTLTSQRLEAVGQQVARLQRAYRAGEVAFSELLRSRLGLFDADLARARARVAALRAQSMMNQASGIEP